ncbi:MAG: hypothetical protein ABI614_15310 [Planctomycetota bacterium]
MTQAVDGMHEIRDRFPKKWWEIKEWLKKMDEPYLDFATYQAKCGELGEQDEQQQETLAARPNDLGIAINYNDDEPTDRDRTRLRYEFAVVPGPLLPKLLVRTFSLTLT